MKRIIRHNLPIHILDYDTENKQAYYKHFYYKWLFINSDTASFKNESIPKNDRLFYLIGKKITETTNNKNDIEFCGTSAGIKLNEIDFINFEIEAYKKYLTYCKSFENISSTNILSFLIKIKDYLKFLSNRKIILEKYPYLLQTYFIDKPDLIVSNNKYCKGACYGILKDFKDLSLKINRLQIEYFKLKEQTNSDNRKEKIKASNYLNKQYLKDLKNLLNEVCYFLATKENDFLETPSNVEILSNLLLHIEEHTTNLSLYWAYPTIEAFEKFKNSKAFKYNAEIFNMTENEYLKYLFNEFDKPFLRIYADENLTISLEFLKEFQIYRKLEKQNKELIKHIENLILELNPPATEKIKEPETKEILKTDLSTSIINGLNKYNFSEYLKETEYCIIKIKNLIKANKSSVPFIIALLSKLGFISYLLDNHFKTKELLFKNLSGTLNCNPRRIKGNVNILNKTSKENREFYTSWQHTENIDLQSLGL